MIVFINGPFGVGKTTVARLVAARLPRSLLYDAEIVGSLLMRALPPGRRPADFQQLRLWRRLTVAIPRLLTATTGRTLVMPMTVWRRAYFAEIAGGLRVGESQFHHFTLTAAPETLAARIRRSGEAIDWRMAHLLPCTTALAAPEFATHIATDDRRPDAVVDAIMAQLPTA